MYARESVHYSVVDLNVCNDTESVWINITNTYKELRICNKLSGVSHGIECFQSDWSRVEVSENRQTVPFCFSITQK